MLDARPRLAVRRSEALLAHLSSSTFLPAALVRQSRSAVIAQMVARAAPTLNQAGLALIADAGLLLFAIDDLLDECDLIDTQVALRVEQYTMTAWGRYCPEVAFDPIAVAIAGLRERLVAQGTGLVDEWARSFQRMLVAMHEERRNSEVWRRHGTRPTLEDYLALGRDSIGVEMVAWVAWIAMADAALQSVLPALREAERHYSLAVRMANDLRSSGREATEGKLNAVVIVGESDPSVYHAIDHALESGRACLARASGNSAARFIDAFAAGLVELYRTRDFHSAGSTDAQAAR